MAKPVFFGEHARREAGRSPFSARSLAGFVAAALTAWTAAAGAASPARLAVSLLQNEGASLQLRVRMPAGVEPDLAWDGTAQPAPYRLALAWDATAVTLDRPLPALPPEGVGPLQSMALQTTDKKAKLEFRFSLPVQPSLRRVGDSWVLRLDPPPAPAASVGQPLADRTQLGLIAPAPGPASGPGPAAAKAAEHPREVVASVSSQASGPRNSGSPQPEPLLVDLTVNGQRQPGIARAEQLPGGAVLIASDSWAEARLAPLSQLRELTDGIPAYALDELPGAHYRLDRRSMSLEVDAPANAFAGSTVATAQPQYEPAPRAEPGALVNYDVSVARAGSAAPLTSGATLEAVAFNGFGNLVTSALASDDGSQRRFARLDSYWRYDMPGRMETLLVGDTVGSSGGWSRPARYAGIRWGRDFGMRPGFVTMPQVSLKGEAALPSTVEVLVNNARRISQSVQPGPFDLPNVPVVTGAGELNLVVRDLLGRETVVTQPYYASPRLLAPGLTDFALEAGWLRTGYATSDSRYGDAFAAGTLRGGLTDGLTGEVRLEAQAERRAAGVELAAVMGDWGLGRMALAGSSSSMHQASEQGHLMQLGIERSTPRGGGALYYEHASRGFAPFGEGTDSAAATQRARQRLVASVGGPVWKTVSGGLSFVRQTRWDGDKVSSLGLSLGLPFWQRGTISLSLSKRLDDSRAWSGGVNVNLPLEDGTYAAARGERRSDGQNIAAVSAARNAPAGPGLGWRVEASTHASQRARAAVQLNGNHGEWTADMASDANGRLDVRAGGRGTVGILAGLPFASRPVGQGSFAVVQVEGMAGVPVKRSNQVVAETDSRGLAFVPNLSPWHKNTIEIDAAEMPLDAEVKEIAKEVVPYARTGAMVRFDVRRSRQALLVLHQADGQPVPLNARVRLLPEGPEFRAGLRGEVWLSGLTAEQQRVQVSWAAGGCELDLQVPAADDGAPGRIGPLACGKDKR